MITRKLKMGMVGGGKDAFIGAVHRFAANLDGRIELVAGAFSSSPSKSHESGALLFLDPNRVYDSYEEMAKAEAKLPVDQRVDFVSIVTPNFAHFPAAKTFLEAGFNVICDKPMTLNLDEAVELREVVRRTGKVFILTHNYTGYPMVKEARELVRADALGRILKIITEYPQGWLLNPIDQAGQKQASWRTDPQRAGASGCIGDIGTHAENLARYITGLEIDELCADFSSFVEGRRLEDDGNVLLRYKGGARGVLYASQVSAGEENNLRIRVYGTKASLEWYQEHPNELTVKYPEAPRQILRRGNGYLSANARRFVRLPSGHPEAFIEAFANIYQEAVRAIEAEVRGQAPPKDLDAPTVNDGVEGMAFIAAAVQSAKGGGVWTKMPTI